MREKRTATAEEIQAMFNGLDILKLSVNALRVETGLPVLSEITTSEEDESAEIEVEVDDHGQDHNQSDQDVDEPQASSHNKTS